MPYCRRNHDFGVSNSYLFPLFIPSLCVFLQDKDARELEEVTRAAKEEQHRLQVEQEKEEALETERLLAEKEKQRQIDQKIREQIEIDRKQKLLQEEERRKLEAKEELDRKLRDERRHKLSRIWSHLSDKVVMSNRKRCVVQGKKSLIRCCEGAYKVKLMLCWSRWRRLRERTQMRKEAMERTIGGIDVSRSLEPLVSSFNMLSTSHSRRNSSASSLFSPFRTPNHLLRGYQMTVTKPVSIVDQSPSLSLQIQSKRRERDVTEEEVNVFKALEVMKVTAPSHSKRMKVSNQESKNNDNARDDNFTSTFRTPKKMVDNQPNLTPMSYWSVANTTVEKGNYSIVRGNGHSNKRGSDSVFKTSETSKQRVKDVTHDAEIALKRSIQHPLKAVSYLDALKRGASDNSSQLNKVLTRAVNENSNYEKSLRAMTKSVPITSPLLTSSLERPTSQSGATTSHSRNNRKLEDQMFEDKLKSLC